MIRVGEKLLQKHGPRKPIILACILVMSGIMLMTLTFLPNTFYTIFVVIGFTSVWNWKKYIQRTG